MVNGLGHKENLYGALPIFEKDALADSRLRKLMEEKRRVEERFTTGTIEKGIQTSNAKNDLVFALVRLGSVLYTHGIVEAGKCRVSYFMRLKHGDLIQNASEFIEMAKENSSLLRKAGFNRLAIPILQSKLKKFEDSLEDKVLNYC